MTGLVDRMWTIWFDISDSLIFTFLLSPFRITSDWLISAWLLTSCETDHHNLFDWETSKFADTHRRVSPYLFMSDFWYQFELSEVDLSAYHHLSVIRWFKTSHHQDYSTQGTSEFPQPGSGCGGCGLGVDEIFVGKFWRAKMHEDGHVTCYSHVTEISYRRDSGFFLFSLNLAILLHYRGRMQYYIFCNSLMKF